jgi:uncharacterized membrane protein
MDLELQRKIDEQGVKVDEILKTVTKIKRYFQIMTWVTIIAVVLPLLGLLFAVPAFMTNYADPLSNVLGE